MLFSVLISEGVEPFDLATFGVLSTARRFRPDIEICMIAPKSAPDWAAHTRSPETIACIRRQAAEIPLVSVCTGDLILVDLALYRSARRPNPASEAMADFIVRHFANSALAPSSRAAQTQAGCGSHE